MNTTPVIDYHFSIYDALQNLGFLIDEKDSGACVAYGFMYDYYGEILVEFYQSFVTNYQTDMKVFYYDETNHNHNVIYLGVAPTNQRDFNILMQLLLPSEEFQECLGMKALDIMA